MPGTAKTGFDIIMGRIVATIDIQNLASPGLSKKIDAFVDTGASYLTLPSAWKEQLGVFSTEEAVELQTATQQVVEGTVCGPVKIKVEGFRSVYNEVLFVDMEPDNGEYEPLLGYLVLEQCGAAVDMIGHRLIPVKYMDLK
ncbi:MAG: retropepsin-like domain-containing protein [Candidatus Thiosymbion ectosymbiont of Robbea hypermnestra]|nr:retropepsin-like domain-containing protein [Candidatus Thiosymbion ectosymbiont of Robbea hypermnestra]